MFAIVNGPCWRMALVKQELDRIGRKCSESLRATFFTKSLYHMPFQLPIDPIRAGLGDASGIEKREERVSNTCLQDLGEGRSATWQYHCSNFSRQTFFYWFQHRTLEPGQNIIQSGGPNDLKREWFFILLVKHDAACFCYQSHCNTVLGQPKLAMGSTILYSQSYCFCACIRCWYYREVAVFTWVSWIDGLEFATVEMFR